MTWAASRSGTRTYTTRPSSSRRSARMAWDRFSRSGPIVSLRLQDGDWFCKRQDGQVDAVSAPTILRSVQEAAALRAAERNVVSVTTSSS